MNEDEKAAIDVRKLFPQVVRRMEILGKLHRTWPSVVGVAAARYSEPYDFIKNDLYVNAANNHTAQIIANMKGNIARALANRYDYHEDIDLKIHVGKVPEAKAKTQPAKTQAKESKQAVKVSVDDNLVNKYIAECPDSLPDDAKFALSHLKAYLEALRPLIKSP
ncbi:MAG: DUF721 domain-containing protein [Synergistaceae bacterium]|nr:DUF721 domain-containing protein [Synergistaceae bacterium]